MKQEMRFEQKPHFAITNKATIEDTFKEAREVVEKIHFNRAELMDGDNVTRTHKFEDAKDAIGKQEREHAERVRKEVEVADLLDALAKDDTPKTAVTVTSTFTNELEPKASTASLKSSNGKTLSIVYIPKMKKGVITIDNEEYAIGKNEADKLRAWYRANLNAKQARAEQVERIASYTSKATSKERISASRAHYAEARTKILESLARVDKKLNIIDNFLNSENCETMIERINNERAQKVEVKQRAEVAKTDDYRKIFNLLVKLEKFSSVDEAKQAYIKHGVNGIGAEIFNTALTLVKLSK